METVPPYPAAEWHATPVKMGLSQQSDLHLSIVAPEAKVYPVADAGNVQVVAAQQDT